MWYSILIIVQSTVASIHESSGVFHLSAVLATRFFQHHKMDQATAVLSEFSDSTKSKTYAAMSALSNIHVSTLWHRAHRRRSRREKAEGQQYLTPSEEKALVHYLLRISNNGFPIPVKFLRSLALIIARQRSSAFQVPPADETVRPPGKNWAEASNKRHPILKARRVKTLDWN